MAGASINEVRESIKLVDVKLELNLDLLCATSGAAGAGLDSSEVPGLFSHVNNGDESGEGQIWS